MGCKEFTLPPLPIQPRPKPPRVPSMTIDELLDVVSNIEITPEFTNKLRKRLRKLDEEFRVYSESIKVTSEILNRTYNL